MASQLYGLLIHLRHTLAVVLDISDAGVLTGPTYTLLVVLTTITSVMLCCH